MNLRPKLACAVFMALSLCQEARAADWPMWRYDAQRTASSPHKLPDKLHLQWVRDLPPLQPAWPDQPKMQFDAAYEPILLGDPLFLPSPKHDWLKALDVKPGKELWTFFADGPIRLAPVAWENHVFFA